MRILVLLLGLLGIIAGAACAASGFASLRSLDQDDYLLSGTAQLTTSTVGFVGSTKELAGSDAGIRNNSITVRIQALQGRGLFLGIAPRQAVEAYLGPVRHEVLDTIRYDPFEARRTAVGSAPAAAPPTESIPWLVAQSGDAPVQLTWQAVDGDYLFAILRADGQPGLQVQIEFGTKFRYQRGFAIAGIAIGGLIVLVGLLLVALALRRRQATGSSSPIA
ncbi:hypothetical protein [Tepidiforma sp.]|uniref:hypothetical protein n=1 Tax=Tepidiforma sp. TaxID=2682230 RepID=UPI002ADD6838|nr:hypothetical protein [Tepidiforma sp.]